MKPFIAKLFYQIISGAGDHTPQFDEQMILVLSEDHKSAYHQAVLIGQQKECTLQNDKGVTVVWKYLHTTELRCLASLSHGTELICRTEEPDDAALFVMLLAQREKGLLEQLSVVT